MALARLIAILSIVITCVNPLPVVSTIRTRDFSSLDCDTCKFIATILQDLLLTNPSETDIEKFAINVCLLFKIEDKNVCTGAVLEFKDEVLGVIDKVALKPAELCGVLLGSDCGQAYDPWDQKWDVPLPNIPKPPWVPIKPPQPTAAKNRILHLSDFHYDPEYTPGLTNDCGEPLCCRPPNPPGNTSSNKAGYWGDYACDLPLWTLENLLQHLANKSDEFDWIYWTGDIPPHNVWNQSREDQLDALKQCVKLLIKYLPDKVVFPSLGNHESAPVNSFPPPYITDFNSNDWLLQASAEEWSIWLPSNALDTIKRGGFYSVLIRGNLRVISLQTNYCNNGNWWLLINGTDPANQLHWLVNELQSAEDKNEKVHIIGHIPAGHGDCIKTWSYNYHKIINRYAATVVGQFFGHTHVDEFEVFYDETNTTLPVNFVAMGPSVTTYSNFNMGYRIYTIDGDYAETTNSLLDFEVFYMNVTDANLHNEPKWIREYSASEDYHMEHCFPQDFDDLIKRFEKDDTLVQKYYNHMTRMHPPTPYCDVNCKASLICAMKTSRSGDHSLCDNLPEGLTVQDIHLKLQEIQAC